MSMQPPYLHIPSLAPQSTSEMALTSIAPSGCSSSLNSISSSSNGRALLVSQKHRVLLYATCYNVLDGVTLTIRKLEEELLAAGHHVCILTTVSGDPANTNLVTTSMPDQQHPNRRVVFMDNGKPIPFVNDPNQPNLTYQIGFSLSAKVKREVEDFEPSIIHITCPDCTALHLIHYARTREIPLMGTYHSNIPEYMEHYPGMSWLKHILAAFFRHQYCFLQALYVPTPFIQKHLEDSYKMGCATKLQVWGRGVDVVKFHPQHRSRKFRKEVMGIKDENEDTVVICWVGRLVPEKRVDIFADVVRRLTALQHYQQETNQPSHLKFRALVVGAGPAEDEVKALPNTTFVGWLNPEQLAVAYASSDIFLFPSSVETFGNVTLEAMASGLPVVVESGCSGHLVSHGCNGYACEAHDSNAFYEATLRLCLNNKERAQFRYTSRQLSLQLEKRAVVKKMLNNYTTVTAEFYEKYCGHHANRDAEYLAVDHSFVAGNHPRPFLLVFVECLFIVLFQVIWNMTSTFVYMQEMLSSFHRRMLPPMMRQPHGFVVEGVSANVGSSESAKQLARQVAMSSPSRRRHVGSSAVSPLEQEGHLVINMPPEHGESPSNGHDGEAGSLDDFGHASTSMSSETESLSLSSGSHDENDSEASDNSAATEDEGESHRRLAFGDGRLPHMAAKGFIRSMEFQMRMESRFRNGFQYVLKSLCCAGASSSHSPRTVLLAPNICDSSVKRKVSADFHNDCSFGLRSWKGATSGVNSGGVGEKLTTWAEPPARAILKQESMSGRSMLSNSFDMSMDSTQGSGCDGRSTTVVGRTHRGGMVRRNQSTSASSATTLSGMSVIDVV